MCRDSAALRGEDAACPGHHVTDAPFRDAAELGKRGGLHGLTVIEGPAVPGQPGEPDEVGVLRQLPLGEGDRGQKRFVVARVTIEEREDGTGMVLVEPQPPSDWKPDDHAASAEAEGVPPTPESITTARARTDAPLKGSEMPHHADHEARMDDWNVVVTCQPYGRRDAARELRRHGPVARTGYPNVLVMRVEDPVAFAEALAHRFAGAPGLANFISRVVPAQITFDFVEASDLEAKVDAHAAELLPQLAGKSFHIRIHRRGLKERLSSHLEEQRIGQALLAALEAAGTPGRAEFDDPDLIVAIETVDHRASLSLWTRDQRQRMPFLKLD